MVYIGTHSYGPVQFLLIFNLLHKFLKYNQICALYCARWAALLLSSLSRKLSMVVSLLAPNLLQHRIINTIIKISATTINISTMFIKMMWMALGWFETTKW